MGSFWPFEFHSRAYLFGLTAALIPLLIHLSRSRRTKKVRFSTTRFFTDQFLRSYRMSRLREKVLLAFRMLLFALFAMALAQPFYHPGGQASAPTGGARGSRAVVLVLDDSASMGFIDRGQTLFDRARKAARVVLDGLGPGDRANILLAARRHADAAPEALLPELTDGLNDLRQALDRLEVTSLGTDLTTALARAETMALASPADSREVYVLSDLQDSGWELQNHPAPTDAGQVSFAFVQVRPQRAVNRAVTAVQFASPRPMVGVPFSFRPLVSFANDDAADARVRLSIDGDLVSERRIERLPSGRWALPRLHHTFRRGGWHWGYVEVEDPHLAQDNRRYFALQVLDTVNVLAVDGAPSRVPQEDELFFVRLALSAAPEGQKAAVQMDTTVPTDLASSALAKYPLVVLANVESLPAAALQRLEDHVEAGGSLMVFLGDKINADFYNESLAGANRRHGGLLPGRLVAIAGNPTSGKDAAFIGAADFRHPALAPFQDSGSGTLLGSNGVALTAFWRIDAPPAAVLMRANDRLGSPLLCERAFGKGRVVLFSSTCDRDWTNFPIRPAFLPWIHQWVAYLAQSPGAASTFHETGARIHFSAPAADAATPLLVRKPGGAVVTAERASEGAGGFVFDETEQMGVYTVLGTDPKAPMGMFAVNLDPYESDLTYLDDVLAGDQTGAERTAAIQAGLKDLLQRPRVNYVDNPDKVLDATANAGQGRGVWEWLLVIVLAIGLLEPWLANRISLRLYGTPRALPVLPAPGPAAAAIAARNLEGSIR